MSSSVSRSEYLSRIRGVRHVLSARSGQDKSARRADAMLSRLERRLSRPARIMLLGEVNGGKTTLANRLLGTDLLTTDVVHNTRSPVLLHYAAAPAIRIRRPDGTSRPLDRNKPVRARMDEGDALEVGLPFDALKDIEVIDTPGASANENIAWVPPRVWGPVDVVVWCTVATQAWRASERAFWTRVNTHRRQAQVLAITHADLLDAADQKKVMHRIERETASRFSSILMIGNDSAAPGTLNAFRDGIAAAVAEVQSQQCQKVSEIIARAMQPAKAGKSAPIADEQPILAEPRIGDLPMDWAPVGPPAGESAATFAV